MFAFESLGGSVLFSLACLFLVPVFRTGRLERWIGGAFAVVGVLSPAAAIGLVARWLEPAAGVPA